MDHTELTKIHPANTETTQTWAVSNALFLGYHLQVKKQEQLTVTEALLNTFMLHIPVMPPPVYRDVFHLKYHLYTKQGDKNYSGRCFTQLFSSTYMYSYSVSWWIDSLTDWLIKWMTERLDHWMTRWPDNQRLNGQTTRWLDNQMTRWLDDQTTGQPDNWMTGLQDHRMTGGLDEQTTGRSIVVAHKCSSIHDQLIDCYFSKQSTFTAPTWTYNKPSWTGSLMSTFWSE